MEGTEFKHVKSFCHEGLTNLLFPFEGVKLDLGKLAIWRIKSHETFGGTWLSDYVPNRLGGFLDEVSAQKTDEIQQQGEHPFHPAWEGEEAGLVGMSMKQ